MGTGQSNQTHNQSNCKSNACEQEIFLMLSCPSSLPTKKLKMFLFKKELLNNLDAHYSKCYQAMMTFVDHEVKKLQSVLYRRSIRGSVNKLAPSLAILNTSTNLSTLVS